MASTPRDLHARKVDRLVRLGVRPQPNPARRSRRLHAVDVGLELCFVDENGRGPVFAVDPFSGAVTRLTNDNYTYTDVHPAPDGVAYAMRSSYARPSHPVRIDYDGTVTELPCAGAPELPGTLTEVAATADDGQPAQAPCMTR